MVFMFAGSKELRQRFPLDIMYCFDMEPGRCNRQGRMQRSGGDSGDRVEIDMEGVLERGRVREM